MKNHLDNNTLDNLIEGFQLISFDWRYIYVNKSVANQGRYSKEDLYGKTMMEKYPGIENTKMFQTLQRCMRDRVSAQMENEFTYSNGTKRWFELRIEPVSEGLFILSIDISDQKHAKEKLMQLNDSLEQMVELRTNELEMKNKSITDSIQYAKRIQKAKLPDRKEIFKSLPNSFVLFKPKDIVSGDFYYFHKDESSIFIASADCTGHGVSGALMSMLGCEKLDDAFARSGDTSAILSHLNKGIKSSLQQSEGDEAMHDGMDIALCSIDIDSCVVRYSGANRPLWIIRNGETIVEEIKGTKTAIGGHTEINQHFDTHVVQLQPGDTFYISTDGYADSFGGDKNKKITNKRFKEILTSIQHKSMQDQKKHLDNFVESWKGSMEQIDDILVIGVRL